MSPKDSDLVSTIKEMEEEIDSLKEALSDMESERDDALISAEAWEKESIDNAEGYERLLADVKRVVVSLKKSLEAKDSNLIKESAEELVSGLEEYF